MKVSVTALYKVNFRILFYEKEALNLLSEQKYFFYEEFIVLCQFKGF
jgi:hypothetical protein